MDMQDLLAELAAMQADYAERSKPARSGYVDPTNEDLAKEEGQRLTFEAVANDLRSLLARAAPAPSAPGARF